MRILIGDPIRFDDILRKFDEERAHDPRMCENSAAIAPLLILSVFEFGCSDCSGLNRDHLLYSTLTARVHLALRSLDAELTRRIERELRDCQRLAERCAADAESAGNVEAANRSNRSSSSAQTEGEEEPPLWFRLSHALGLTNRHLRGLRALLQSKARVPSPSPGSVAAAPHVHTDSTVHLANNSAATTAAKSNSAATASAKAAKREAIERAAVELARPVRPDDSRALFLEPAEAAQYLHRGVSMRS